ncbi:MAG: glycosyltransferase [Legionellaceae bacterium]|nr:glycosyltransferase [Legionellaceae bacterium]
MKKEEISLENTIPQFSIILPVRNGGEHIKLCMASILGQTYHDFELLVLENCSTDGTAEWLQSIEDKRVKIFPAESPLSLEDNWSRISLLETKEFLTIIGHDDLYDAHYLEVMSALIKNHPLATLYQAHFRFIDAEGHFLRYCRPMCEVQAMHEFVAKQMTFTIDGSGSGFMFRKRDFQEVGGFPDYHRLIFGDWQLWVKLAEKKYIATAMDVSFSFREHQSASATCDRVVYQKYFFSYCKFLVSRGKRCIKLQHIIENYAPYFLLKVLHAAILDELNAKSMFTQPSLKNTIDKFSILADEMGVRKQFSPLSGWRIKFITLFDSNVLMRMIYGFSSVVLYKLFK